MTAGISSSIIQPYLPLLPAASRDFGTPHLGPE